MLRTPLLVTALSAVLGGGAPFPSDAAPDGEPSKLSDDAVQRTRLAPDVAPPDSRFDQPPVGLPAALGVCFGLAAGVFYKLAADQEALLRAGDAVQTRNQLLLITQAGARNQTLSAVMAGAGLVSLGVAGFLAFSPRPGARAAVSVSPTAGGAAAVLQGSW